MPCFLVPVDVDGIDEQFLSLIDVFDPDEIARHDLLSPINKGIQQQLNQRLGVFRGARMHNFVGSDTTGYPIPSITEIVPVTNPIAVSNPILSVADSMRLALLSLSGSYSEATVEALDSVDELNVSEFEVATENQISKFCDFLLETEPTPSNPLTGITPSNLASHGLGWYHSGPIRTNEVPVTVVVGGTAADFCLYTSIRALGVRAIWLPEEIAKAYDSDVVADSPLAERSQLSLYVMSMAKALYRHLGHDKDIGPRILVTSNSLNLSESKQIFRLLDPDISMWLESEWEERVDYKTSVEAIGKLAPSANTRWEINNLGSVNYSAQIFMKGSSGTPMPTPKPKHVRFADDTTKGWVTDAVIEGVVLPRRNSMVDLLLPNGHDFLDARISKNGLAYYSIGSLVLGGDDLDAKIVKPLVSLPDQKDVFRQLFADHGLELRTSSAGNYLSTMSELFGGLTRMIDALNDATHSAVLSKFIDTSPAKKGVSDNGWISKDKRRYLDSRSISTVVSGDDVAARNSIKWLLTSGLVRRGLVEKCPYCLAMEWYSNESVGQTYRCIRCGETTLISANSEWFFGLHEGVREALAHNQDVTVRTLSVIAGPNVDSFMWLPASDVHAIDSDGDPDKPLAEVDFVALKDGELVIGECKSNGILLKKDEAQMERIANLAERVRADRLIFATTAHEWKPAAKARIAKLTEKLNAKKISVEEIVVP